MRSEGALPTRQGTPARKAITLHLDVPTADWLLTHSLRAKRLTIFDALAPTAVKHRSVYVPIIGKTVHAKALADVFSHYQVETESGDVLHVNPAGANLRQYEADLLKALRLYNARYKRLVLRAMDADTRRALKATPEALVRDKLDAFATRGSGAGDDGAGDANLTLMRAEIELGEGYLRQSQEMRASIGKRPAVASAAAVKKVPRSSSIPKGARLVNTAGSGGRQHGDKDRLVTSNAIGRSRGNGTHRHHVDSSEEESADETESQHGSEVPYLLPGLPPGACCANCRDCVLRTTTLTEAAHMCPRSARNTNSVAMRLNCAFRLSHTLRLRAVVPAAVVPAAH